MTGRDANVANADMFATPNTRGTDVNVRSAGIYATKDTNLMTRIVARSVAVMLAALAITEERLDLGEATLPPGVYGTSAMSAELSGLFLVE